MGHPQIENLTPFAVECLFVSDEEGRPIIAPIVKGTYRIGNGGTVTLAPDQVPVNLMGKRTAPSDDSSYEYEPETAFCKATTDVVLIAHAHVARGLARELDVSLKVGPLHKTVRVTGDRTWNKRLTGRIVATDPTPFESMALVYERAFGGWDRSRPDAQRYAFEPRNPVGTGFVARGSGFREGVSLPNLENPKHTIQAFGDTVAPAAFGFVGPDWQPRCTLAGTYDEAWRRERMPLLPRNFDRRFFNAATPDLVAPGYLRGNEPVHISNVSPRGDMRFDLPAVPPPRCDVYLRGGAHHMLETNLDTVIVNARERALLLIWRSAKPILAEPHHLRALVTKSAPQGY
jgi:hypothetical protein